MSVTDCEANQSMMTGHQMIELLNYLLLDTVKKIWVEVCNNHGICNAFSFEGSINIDTFVRHFDFDILVDNHSGLHRRLTRVS